MVFAVIKTGGKQYRVAQGDRLSVEKLPQQAGEEVSFLEVLLLQQGDDVVLGAPLVEGAVVKAKLLEQVRSPKILVFKKRRRKNFRRKNGHRQPASVVEIVEILKSA